MDRKNLSGRDRRTDESLHNNNANDDYNDNDKIDWWKYMMPNKAMTLIIIITNFIIGMMMIIVTMCPTSNSILYNAIRYYSMQL